MPIYKCAVCEKIAEFPQEFESELKETECSKCNKVGKFKKYTGPLAASMLKAEDARSTRLKAELEATLDEIEKACTERDKIGKDKQAKEREYDRMKAASLAEIAAYRDQIEQFNKDLIAKTSQINELKRKVAQLDDDIETLGNRPAVHKDAPKAYNNAQSVKQNSGKNKLYIGSRQHVSAHAGSDPKRKARILDVPNWSPGLNVSWIEGGIAAKAQFKIKIDPGNQYHTIPDSVMQKLKDVPNMDPSAFHKLCKTEGKNSLLWYDKDGKDRPTWTALEIWCLLRAGYRFTFLDRKNGSGKKIVLVPPA